MILKPPLCHERHSSLSVKIGQLALPYTQEPENYVTQASVDFPNGRSHSFHFSFLFDLLSYAIDFKGGN